MVSTEIHVVVENQTLADWYYLIGLGGTSLINANIFLRADEKTMGMQAWPPELREEGALDECTYFSLHICCMSQILTS